MFFFLAEHFSKKEFVIDLILLGFLVVAWLAPEFGKRVLDPIENFSARLARRRGLAILLIALLTIFVRVSLLGLLPVPVPRVHDEFSYLLAADTFAHGRLTNPPHPMWVFFETIHVNQQPTYMSKYPPAQGAVLALGQLLGQPWIGVLLSAAAMCAAILWMLQGWFPPKWALLGAVLVLLRLAIFSYWINSYWGGSVAAIGGALVAGALPRILKFQRRRDALLLGIGAAILANSRPLEGAILCLPVTFVLLAWFARNFHSNWRRALSELILPLGAILLLCGAFMAYYNWRGTGDALLFPYQVNERTYLSTPTLFWEKPRLPLQYRNAQLESYYNGWSHKYWSQNRMDSFNHAVLHISLIALKLIYFFLWPELCVAFLALPWLLRDHRMRTPLVLVLVCSLGFLLVPWVEAHYAAPMMPLLFALAVQGLRHLRRWRHAGRPVGIGLCRAVVLAALVFAPFHHRSGTFEPETDQRPKIEQRAAFLAQLETTPGEHLVIVRYSPVQSGGEWVYNDADIDHARVVWAREIPGTDLRPLLDYFRGRRVWLAQPDLSPPTLTPFAQ
ncbi:MAG TPA: hypothetical protein VJN89_19955 [Candidatus Acidoferrum sp.]|nr:hypothetical protein [Candidatus Acidoferrum sp.]